jgi:hypothetical protein
MTIRISEAPAAIANCATQSGSTCSACASGYTLNTVLNSGYSGDGVACADVNDCADNEGAGACQNGAACSDTGANSYSCTCANGFSGTICDECAAGKGFVAAAGQGDQGTCADCAFENREWNNEVTHNAACATQECDEGSGVTSDSTNWAATGSNCVACGAGYESAQGQGQCADIDECATDNGG